MQKPSEVLDDPGVGPAGKTLVEFGICKFYVEVDKIDAGKQLFGEPIIVEPTTCLQDHMGIVSFEDLQKLGQIVRKHRAFAPGKRDTALRTTVE